MASDFQQKLRHFCITLWDSGSYERGASSLPLDEDESFCSPHGLHWHHGMVALLTLGDGECPESLLECLWCHASGEVFGCLVIALLRLNSELPICPFLAWVGASQVALVVKNLPANTGDKEMRVQSLGWEDPLEEGTATHSRFLAWRIPWTEEPGGLWSIGVHRVEYDWWVLAPTYCFQNRMVIVQNVSLLLGFLLSRFFFFLNLAVPGLTCGMEDPCCHVQDLHYGMYNPVPWSGIKPWPSALGAVLTTGPPGKSVSWFFDWKQQAFVETSLVCASWNF